MEMWSKGLGRTELSMNPMLCKIDKDPNGDNLVVYGNVQAPVDWEFKVTIRPEDFAGIIKLSLSYTVIKHFVKHMVKTMLSLTFGKDKNGAPQEGLIEKVNLAYEQIMTPATSRRRPKMERVFDN